MIIRQVLCGTGSRPASLIRQWRRQAEPSSPAWGSNTRRLSILPVECVSQNRWASWPNSWQELVSSSRYPNMVYAVSFSNCEMCTDDPVYSHSNQSGARKMPMAYAVPVYFQSFKFQDSRCCSYLENLCNCLELCRG